MFVVDSLDLSVMAMAAEGGTVLVLDNHDSQSKNSWFETQPARFKTAWWLGSPTDNNMGTVVYDDRWEGLFDGMAPEGWADEGWFRLIEGGPSSLSKPLSLAMCQPCTCTLNVTAHPRPHSVVAVRALKSSLSVPTGVKRPAIRGPNTIHSRRHQLPARLAAERRGGGESYYPQSHVGRGWGISNSTMGAVRLPKILVLTIVGVVSVQLLRIS